MRTFTLFLFIALASFGLNAQTDHIQDGSFEGGTSGTAWTGNSTNWGTPICNPTDCGGGVSNTGTWFAWFGGGGATLPEIGTVEQSVTIPTAPSATLSFYLLIGASGSSNDSVSVWVNGSQIWSKSSADTAGFAQDYAEVQIDMSPYTGQTITLTFEGRQTTATTTNMYVDDVSLTTPGTVGVDAPLISGSVKAFPNPAKDQLTLDFNFAKETDMRFELIALNGQVVHNGFVKEVAKHSALLDVSGFSSGVYFLKAYWAEGVLTEKITIE